MSSKRRREHRTGSHHHSSGAKRSRRRKHLYLVLDDWIKGFSIHKIDADSFHSDRRPRHDDDDRDRVAAWHHLTAPPAVRLQAPAGEYPDMLFTALGNNKIFIVTDKRYGKTPALIYDTETSGLAFGPSVPPHLHRGVSVVVAAGDALYAFLPPVYNMDTLEVLLWSQAALDCYNPSLEEEEASRWTSIPGPHPEFERLEIITAYALHPDGHTVFMTTCGQDRPGIRRSTISFNTKTRVWRWHSWALPFRGPGFFDRELDAWVGLHRRKGHICCCRVDTVDRGSETPIKLGAVQLDLDYQVLEENLYRSKDRNTHIRASLACMGESTFCLVEKAIHKGGESDLDFYPSASDGGCALHMTILTLKYNHRGELRTSSHHSTCSYLVPKYRDQSCTPVPFWM